jgi:hypothetical protein
MIMMQYHLWTLDTVRKIQIYDLVASGRGKGIQTLGPTAYTAKHVRLS